MSSALTDLETALSAQLFLRYRGRGLELTSSGRALLPMARHLLAEARELEELAGSLQSTLAGRLTLGCFDAVSPALMTPLIAEFTRRHPEVRFDVVSASQGELQRALSDGSIELAFLYEVNLDSDLIIDTMFESVSHVVLPAAHPLAGREAVALDELVDNDLILLSSSPALVAALRGFAVVGYVPTLRYELANFDLIRSMVHRGLGYTLITQPRGFPPHHWGAGITAVLVSDAMPSTNAAVVRSKVSRLTARAEAYRVFCLTDGRALVGGR
ncbi:hypothetical protein D7252_17680 [Microbacterium sp. CGR2]|nr:hypothetical protein D7252_17680 [Microbacterium sp. CGR2]